MIKPNWQDTKLWAAIVGAVLMIIVAFVPALESAQADLLQYIPLLIVAAIAGDSFDGIIKSWLQKPGSVDKTKVIVARGLDKLELYLNHDIPDELETWLVNTVGTAAADYAVTNVPPASPVA